MTRCFLRSLLFLFLAIIPDPVHGAADYSIKTLAELKECEAKAEKGDAHSLYALGGYYFKGEIPDDLGTAPSDHVNRRRLAPTRVKL
jgi:hypothetical protein